MATLVISQSAAFGQMTNSIVQRMIGLNSSVPRLQEGIATASSGYEGVPGTEFEIGNMAANIPPGPNLFGVQADPDNPGKNGQAFAYAVGQLEVEWTKFWAAAAPYLQALDNGQGM